jgi:hypothetical protein
VGVDLNKPRIRAVLAGVLALSALPAGFTAAGLAAKVQAMTGREYTARQAAYDLQEPARQGPAGQTRPHPALPRPTPAIRTATALVVLRDEVIAPTLAGVRVPRRGRKSNHWTQTDQHYEPLRQDMKALPGDCGIAA